MKRAPVRVVESGASILDILVPPPAPRPNRRHTEAWQSPEHAQARQELIRRLDKVNPEEAQLHRAVSMEELAQFAIEAGVVVPSPPPRSLRGDPVNKARAR